MNLFKFLLQKKLYLLLNVLILLIGFFFVYSGISLDLCHRVKSGIYISIGTSLIAAGIVVFLDLLKQITISKVLERHNNIITEAGIEWIYKKRGLDKYDSLMDNLYSELDIAGYSLGAFFDSYSELVKRKVNSGNLKIRILLVKPDSIHSFRRAEIEGRSPDQFKDKIDTLVKFFKDLKGIEMRYFDAPLSTMIFRIDKVMFVGPHFYKIQSKATLTQELKYNHWLYEEYKNEFERMWNDAIPIG